MRRALADAWPWRPTSRWGLDMLAEGLPRGVLLEAAQQVGQVRQAAAGTWPEARLGQVDVAALAQQLSLARRQAAARYAARALAERGIDVYFGPLVFATPNRLKIAGETLNFSRALLAPIARTAIPPIEGLEEIGYRTPQTLGTLAELPRRLAIVGASTMACELAQAFRRLGSAVDLIIPQQQLLSDQDPVIAEMVQRQFTADGIVVHRSWDCVRGQRTGAVKSLTLERAGKFKKLLADEILVAGSRRYEQGWLRPAAAQIDVDEVGFRADAQLRTSNPLVLAIGPNDVEDLLSSDAVEAMARLAVDNSLSLRKQSLAERVVPRWLRTDPLVYWLGAETAADSSHVFQVNAAPGLGAGMTVTGLGLAADRAPSDWQDAAAVADSSGSLLILRVSAASRRLVGATVVGPAARELAAPLSAFLTRASAGSSGGWLDRFFKSSPAAAPQWLIEAARAAGAEHLS